MNWAITGLEHSGREILWLPRAQKFPLPQPPLSQQAVPNDSLHHGVTK